MTAAGGVAHGAMEKLSKTWGGLTSTIEGKFQYAMVTAGGYLIDVFKPVLEFLVKILTTIDKDIQAFAIMFGVLTAAIVAAAIAVKALGVSIGVLLAATGWGLLIAAIGVQE